MIRAREAKMTIFRPYFLKSLKSLKMERAEGARALKPPFEAPDPPNPQKFSNLRAPQNPRGTPSALLICCVTLPIRGLYVGERTAPGLRVKGK